MARTIALLQSNYIPWKGYFDIIRRVDHFVIYDVVQYTKNDFRNRNRLIVNGRPTWLTIPVRQHSLQQRIDETEISDPRWCAKHMRTIEQSYGKAPGFEQFWPTLRERYVELSKARLLSTVNSGLIRTLCSLMDIDTPISSADAFDLPDDRVERIIAICKALGGDRYLSGPAARHYLDPLILEEEGIECLWMDYAGYPAYQQRTEPFDHQVSVLDLLFQTGTDFRRYLDRS